MTRREQIIVALLAALVVVLSISVLQLQSRVNRLERYAAAASQRVIQDEKRTDAAIRAMQQLEADCNQAFDVIGQTIEMIGQDIRGLQAVQKGGFTQWLERPRTPRTDFIPERGGPPEETQPSPGPG